MRLFLGLNGRDGAPGQDADDVNECLTNNGGCEDICINTFKGYYCACGVGKELISPVTAPNCDGMRSHELMSVGLQQMRCTYRVTYL